MLFQLVINMKLFFIKDKDGSFWDGGYQYEMSQNYNINHPSHHLKVGWNVRPRFFRSLPALIGSMNELPKFRPYCKPITVDTGYGNRRLENKYRTWNRYKKEHKLNSIDIAILYAKQGWITHELDEGEALRSAKPLDVIK